jgi:hypothetical protein
MRKLSYARVAYELNVFNQAILLCLYFVVSVIVISSVFTFHVSPTRLLFLLKHKPLQFLISLHLFSYYQSDRLCGLVVRVPGYTTEMYCDSCEVRTEFIYVI